MRCFVHLMRAISRIDKPTIPTMVLRDGFSYLPHGNINFIRVKYLTRFVARLMNRVPTSYRFRYSNQNKMDCVYRHLCPSTGNMEMFKSHSSNLTVKLFTYKIVTLQSFHISLHSFVRCLSNIQLNAQYPKICRSPPAHPTFDTWMDGKQDSLRAVFFPHSRGGADGMLQLSVLGVLCVVVCI